MSGLPDIASLVPHSGSMCLLERILDWNDASIRCASGSHRHPDHPLAGPRGLRAVHLCEYGAQAMAVHGGLLAAARAERAAPGMLVSLRDVELRVADLGGLTGELIVSAERLATSADAWQYRFEARHEEFLLARGLATVAVRRPAPAPFDAPRR